MIENCCRYHFLFVSFHGRCHHCHEVIQLLEEVAEAVKHHGIFLAKLDIEANKEAKNRSV